jgi:hypothetical protein
MVVKIRPEKLGRRPVKKTPNPRKRIESTVFSVRPVAGKQRF